MPLPNTNYQGTDIVLLAQQKLRHLGIEFFLNGGTGAQWDGVVAQECQTVKQEWETYLKAKDGDTAAISTLADQTGSSPDDVGSAFIMAQITQAFGADPSVLPPGMTVGTRNLGR